MILGTFKSQSDPDVEYNVSEGTFGEMVCNCPGFENHQTCWHVNKVWAKKELDKFRQKKAELNRGKLPDFKKLQEEQWAYIQARKDHYV